MTNPRTTNVHETTAVIDNGSFGTRTIRFETGRLARQAAGSVVAYLDDETMLLSATTASKQPKEHFDFFPLTVDVEERMYAIGKIPGSFFRREGRPGTDAILTCRLIDRPLRPSFVDGLRNEIQIVVTVMSLDPQDPYDALAINAASASTQLRACRSAARSAACASPSSTGQWVAFPTSTRTCSGPCSTWSSPAASSVSDVAIMMVEAEATTETIELVAGGAQAPTEDVVGAGPGGGEAVHPHACASPSSSWPTSPPSRPASYPTFPAYQPDVLDAVTAQASDDLAQALTIAGKQEREARIDEVKAAVLEKVGAAVRGPREGDRRRVPVAEQEAGPPPDPHRPGPHRRPRHHRHPAAVGRGRGRPAGARLGAVRARRDPDHGRHHAEHAAHGAADRLARPGDAQALPAPLQLPAVLHR